MHAPHFLIELVTTLCAAALVVLASHRARVPTVVALLAAGVVIGPSGFGFVSHSQTVEQLAEMGVVALLFTLGLEFSRERVREVRGFFAIGGPMQMGLSMLGAALVVAPMGANLRQAVFAGFLLALSSTAIVLKLYAERRELEAPHGRFAIGVLLFQDVMLAPMIAVTPLLASTGDASIVEELIRVGAAVATIGAAFGFVRFALPLLLAELAASRSRELLLMTSISLCLAAALLTTELGFSPALGAFLAGILLADSDVSHQVSAEIGPFRDVFTSLFFVSIGMLLDFQWALAHAGAITAVTTGILGLKILAVLVAGMAFQLPARTAILAAFGLAQIGEFSFVLAGVGRGIGLLGDGTYQTFIAASILTMIATPALVAIAPRIGVWAEGRLGFRPPTDSPREERSGHVVVAGFGVNGRNLVRVMSEAKVPFVVIEMNPQTVRQARETDVPILYGDSARREILSHVGIERARILVLTMPDPMAVRRAVQAARAVNPDLHIIVRTRHLGEIEELTDLGADEVIAEEFETSIEILSRVLTHYHIPRNVTDTQIRLLRAGSYEMLRTPGRPISDELLQVLEAGTTEVFRLKPSCKVIGKSLRDLDLRNTTGASVIALVRDQKPIANPPATLALAEGDTLVLVGGHAELEAAFQLLG